MSWLRDSFRQSSDKKLRLSRSCSNRVEYQITPVRNREAIEGGLHCSNTPLAIARKKLRQGRSIRLLCYLLSAICYFSPMTPRDIVYRRLANHQLARPKS